MVLEALLVFCVTAGVFEKKKIPQNGTKTEVGFFLNLAYKKFILFAVFLQKSHAWEKFSS